MQKHQYFPLQTRSVFFFLFKQQASLTYTTWQIESSVVIFKALTKTTKTKSYITFLTFCFLPVNP